MVGADDKGSHIPLRNRVVAFLEAGDAPRALRQMESTVFRFGGDDEARALEDGLTPSMFYYAGVAHQLLGDLKGATRSYGQALRFDPNDVQAWMHLGDCLLYRWEAAKALAAYGEARRLLTGGSGKQGGSGLSGVEGGSNGALSGVPSVVLGKLSRVHSWTCAWGPEAQGIRDELKHRMTRWHQARQLKTKAEQQQQQQQQSEEQQQSEDEEHERAPVNPADFGDLPSHVLRALTRLLPQADPFIPSGAGEALQHRRHFNHRHPLSSSASLSSFATNSNSSSAAVAASSAVPTNGSSTAPATKRSKKETKTPAVVDSESAKSSDRGIDRGGGNIKSDHGGGAESSGTLLQQQQQQQRQRPQGTPRPPAAASAPLHIGFLSSDFGVHPVSALLRGFLASLARRSGEVEVSCWVLSDEDSWWRQNISATMQQQSPSSASNPGKTRRREKSERFVSLHGLPYAVAAGMIKDAGVDVLVDLNGHTKGSGLPLLRFRPAPVQVSWLGFPSSTGAPFVDFFVCDPVACDPTMARQLYSEKLLLLPLGTSYLVNDHAQMHAHALMPTPATVTGVGGGGGGGAVLSSAAERVGKEREWRREASGFNDILRKSSSSGSSGRSTTVNHSDRGGETPPSSSPPPSPPLLWNAPGTQGPLLATFSNWMKMDRDGALAVWANVLRRVPSATLWVLEHDLHAAAVPNLRRELLARGVWASPPAQPPAAKQHSTVTSPTTAGDGNDNSSSSSSSRSGVSRLVSTPSQPWIHHVRTKAAADLLLDTPQTKNAHSTSLDGLWGGVPLLTLAGEKTSQRAGASLLSALHRREQAREHHRNQGGGGGGGDNGGNGGAGNDEGKEKNQRQQQQQQADTSASSPSASSTASFEWGRVYSLKEYEDVAVEVASNPTLLHALRALLVESSATSTGGARASPLATVDTEEKRQQPQAEGETATGTIEPTNGDNGCDGYASKGGRETSSSVSSSGGVEEGRGRSSSSGSSKNGSERISDDSSSRLHASGSSRGRGEGGCSSSSSRSSSKGSSSTLALFSALLGRGGASGASSRVRCGGLFDVESFADKFVALMLAAVESHENRLQLQVVDDDVDDVGRVDVQRGKLVGRGDAGGDDADEVDSVPPTASVWMASSPPPPPLLRSTRMGEVTANRTLGPSPGPPSSTRFCEIATFSALQQALRSDPTRSPSSSAAAPNSQSTFPPSSAPTTRPPPPPSSPSSSSSSSPPNKITTPWKQKQFPSSSSPSHRRHPHKHPEQSRRRQQRVRRERLTAFFQNADGSPLLLNVGGLSQREGWTVVNVEKEQDQEPVRGAHDHDHGRGKDEHAAAAGEAAGLVDVYARMHDLWCFDDSTVTAVYASHVLEHASYRLPPPSTPLPWGADGAAADEEENEAVDDDNSADVDDGDEEEEGEEEEEERRSRWLGTFADSEVAAALEEWHRVLVPGGALFVAVPDLDVLTQLYANASLAPPEKFFVMRMIFGGQVDPHDIHFTGFDQDLLAQLLTASGFCEVRRVPSFGLFSDTSEKRFKGVPISLNVVATACKSARDGRPMSEDTRIYVSIPGRGG